MQNNKRDNMQLSRLRLKSVDEICGAAHETPHPILEQT